jgi:crotonobetainyl-CoA:carnitine CoA-transferase CaiB-like acyl-CoA transferase
MSGMSGIRVVEFEGWTAGSLLGMLFADQGAEVIRVARPGDPILSGAGSQMLARGKKSLVLDLQIPADKEVAKRLATTADIVIENLRPGALDEFGVGCTALRGINPRLVHINLPGFASSDATHASVAAYDGIIAATLGMFTEINLLKPTFEMDPVYTPLALPSIYGAVQGAIACNAALIARDKTGHGASLEVPLASAAAMAMSSIYMKVDGAPEHYQTPRLPQFVKSFVLPMVRRFVRHSSKRQQWLYAKAQSAVPAMMSAYPCADGRLLYVFAIDNAPLATQLLKTLGLLDGALAFGFETASPYESSTSAFNLAATSTLPPKAQAWLRNKMGAAFLTKPAAEWEELFCHAGVPACIVRTTAEWMDWQPLADCDAFISRDGLKEPGVQCWFPDEETSPMRRSPTRDEHGPALREEASQIALPISAFVEPCSAPWQPLAGIKVIDFSSMVAGPVAGRTLGEFGATVVKIEGPAPNHGPRMTCWYGLDVNQGKDSILIDLKSIEGKRIAAKIIKDADVVIHNFSPAAAHKLGLSRASLQQINPKIIACEIAAFAGPRPSALDYRHGYDPVLQMASGISVRYGTRANPELHGIASCIDCLTGYSAAFGVVAALAANRRGQNRRAVKTSLVQAANLIHLTMTIWHRDKPRLAPTHARAFGKRAMAGYLRNREALSKKQPLIKFSSISALLPRRRSKSL